MSKKEQSGSPDPNLASPAPSNKQAKSLYADATTALKPYSMFSLGHADAFAAGDLALQESARILFELDDRPTESTLRDLAEKWSPWRAVAARILWRYYHVMKERSGLR